MKKNFLFLLVSTIIITGIITMSYPVLPSSFFEGLNLFFILMPLLGIAVVLESILMKKNYIYFFIGLFIAILLKIVLENM